MSESNRVRTLGAILYEDFEPLDLYGPLEMFGLLAPELQIVTVAEQAVLTTGAVLAWGQAE